MKSLLLPGIFALLALPAAFAGSGAHPAADKFAAMDTNGDGRLSLMEHGAGAHDLFLKSDTDRDGIVTAAELAVIRNSRADTTAVETASPRGNPQADLQAASDKIRVIDQDGDGKLTSAEHEAGAKHVFVQMDTDGDGSLTSEEFQQGHARLVPKN
jgi:hypothetical protein